MYDNKQMNSIYMTLMLTKAKCDGYTCTHCTLPVDNNTASNIPDAILIIVADNAMNENVTNKEGD
jgi:hypothetical protein